MAVCSWLRPPRQQHRAIDELEQAKRRNPASARNNSIIVMNSVCQEAQTRAMAAALMRTKTMTVVRLAVSSRPVCPSVTRAMTARIMTAMAPAVSAWIAEASGMPMLKMDSPSNAVPIATHP